MNTVNWLIHIPITMLSNLRENYTYNIVQFNNQGFTLSDNPDSDYWPKRFPLCSSNKYSRCLCTSTTLSEICIIMPKLFWTKLKLNSIIMTLFTGHLVYLRRSIRDTRWHSLYLKVIPYITMDFKMFVLGTEC